MKTESDVLPLYVKRLLERSIEQSEKGEVRSHEEVMAEINKRYEIVK